MRNLFLAVQHRERVLVYGKTKLSFDHWMEVHTEGALSPQLKRAEVVLFIEAEAEDIWLKR